MKRELASVTSFSQLSPDILFQIFLPFYWCLSRVNIVCKYFYQVITSRDEWHQVALEKYTRLCDTVGLLCVEHPKVLISDELPISLPSYTMRTLEILLLVDTLRQQLPVEHNKNDTLRHCGDSLSDLYTLRRHVSLHMLAKYYAFCRDILERIYWLISLTSWIGSRMWQEVRAEMTPLFPRDGPHKWNSLMPEHITRPFLFDSILLYLRDYPARKNFHWRDMNILFDEESHCYSILTQYRYTGTALDDTESRPVLHWLTTTGSVKEQNYSKEAYEMLKRSDVSAPLLEKDVYLSVTSFIGTLFRERTSENIFDEMVANTGDKIPARYGEKTREEIIDEWIQTGEEASAKGTRLHRTIELYYTGHVCCPVMEYREFTLFKRFERERVHGKLRPYATEKRFYSEIMRLCGTADMLYEYIDDDECDPLAKKRLVLVDWKNVKMIRKDGYAAGCVACTENAVDCNYVHFTLQTGLYKTMAEDKYDYRIDQVWIVNLHASQQNYGLEVIDFNVTYIKHLLEDVVIWRIDEVTRRIEASRHELLPELYVIAC